MYKYHGKWPFLRVLGIQASGTLQLLHLLPFQLHGSQTSLIPEHTPNRAGRRAAAVLRAWRMPGIACFAPTIDPRLRARQNPMLASRC